MLLLHHTIYCALLMFQFHRPCIILAAMQLSDFGRRFTRRTGILELMADLGSAVDATGPIHMLGGGNPALIPEMNVLWRTRMEQILANADEYERMIGAYDAPQGRLGFRKAVASFLRRRQGWDVTEEHIAVTNGSQTGFFLLFNALAGRSSGSTRRILFPVIPEYIGYADQMLHDDCFVGRRPTIEDLGNNRFKYHVDFSSLDVPPDAAAICISRPTNPTGNVITDQEIAGLDQLAQERGIPLMVDNAYGVPFPSMIYTDATPSWNENTILAMSLSKIGLPAVRTGILVARPEVIQAVSGANAILSLANGSFGQVLLQPFFESGEILNISRDVIEPYYRAKSQKAQKWIDELFRGRVDYAIHASEGALFLWVWFKSLKGTTEELYHRLKARNTIVVPGRYFFFGLPEKWGHQDECIRINFAMPDDEVYEGLRIIAEEAQQLQA